MEKQWTVTDLTRYLRQLFEMDYRLSKLTVEGEVSNFRVPSSGHAYFTLKDSKAQLKCVMFGFARQGDSYQPKQGDRVLASGNIGLYEAGGQYQLYCSSIEPVGVGSLHEEFERLKSKLQDEGLFEADHKQPLPAFPLRVGVVTSATTAALQDALNVLRRRNPLMQVMLSPAVVQGQAAPSTLIRALESLIDEKPDVILLIRGGGSLEDLWAFNDEQLVRTVADITQLIPIVSGVGHEIDFTLVDFAASVRAPTPSAAAELVAPMAINDLLLHVGAIGERLQTILDERLQALHLEINTLSQRLRYTSPERMVENSAYRLEQLKVRLERANKEQLDKRRQALDALRVAVNAADPNQVLARGFAIVYSPEGTILRSAADVQPDTRLAIRLSDGTIDAITLSPEKDDA